VRLPYERLLLYLVSRKADVNLALARYDLPEVRLQWINEWKEEIRKDAPFCLTYYHEKNSDIIHMTSGLLEWAEAHGIRELWESQPELGGKVSPHLDLSIRIFVHPFGRCVMGMLLLAEITKPGIIEVIKDRLGFKIDGEFIDYYRTTFWNPGVMARADWACFADSLLTKEERHFISFALSAPSLEEIRYALELRVVADPENIVRDIMMKAWFKFNATYETADPADPKLWSDVALKAYNSLTASKKVNAGEIDTIPADIGSMFAVQIERSSHTSLSELQGVLSVSAGPKKPEPKAGS
jgi:hypothetical protein